MIKSFFPPHQAMTSPGTTSSPLSILAPKTKAKKKHFVQQKVEVFRSRDPVLTYSLHSMFDKE
uniref:Uncharacterized protein n=1 Tax=Salmo trutta TaxID=8032 RepID=A0A673WD20_SALTR